MSVELKNVTKKFGDVVAVKDLDLKISSHDFTTLLGPSGCGKSTTLRMIAGLEEPTEGEIWINGECVYSKEKNIYFSAKKRKLGMVFQSYALWPHLTVLENISFGLEINKKENIKEKVEKVTKVLKINDLLNRYPNELSGGQQQRVAIARVLVMDYDLLLLDEPLSNLDAKLRMDMRAELKRIHQELDLTIVYVTHDQLEALTMSTNIAVLDEGLLQDYGPPIEVYNSPSNIFTANFMGNPPINFIENCIIDTIIDNKAIIKGEGIEVSVSLDKFNSNKLEEHYNNKDKIIMGIRPEDINLNTRTDEEHEIGEGEIYSVLPAGSEWYYKIKATKLDLTVTEYTDKRLNKGEKVSINVNENKIKLFDNNKSSLENKS